VNKINLKNLLIEEFTGDLGLYIKGSDSIKCEIKIENYEWSKIDIKSIL
jgi:hypothetical protein